MKSTYPNASPADKIETGRMLTNTYGNGPADNEDRQNRHFRNKSNVD